GMRSVRKQLADRNELLKDNAEAEPLVKAANGLIARLDDVEAKLHNPKAQVGYDILAMRGGAKLYSELIWLFELLKDGDGAPTQGVREMYAEEAQELKQLEAELQGILTGDLAKLNELAKK